MESLEDYSKEIGLREAMTLDALIESHRHLRTLNLEFNDQWRKELTKGYERGCAEGKTLAMEQDFLSIDRLRTMTIGELSVLIVGPESV